MNQLIEFIVLATVLVLAMNGISRLAKWIAKKRNLNPKFVGYIFAFVVFLICSALWNFTPIYYYISQITGIPLAR